MSEQTEQGIQVQEHIEKFCRILKAQLLEEGGIPAAFAVMVTMPLGTMADQEGYIVQHNIITGSSRELLPKGADEAEEMLKQGLRHWESIAHPDKVSLIGKTVGSA